MDAYKLNVKLYFEPSARIDAERLIPVFHRFIQDQKLDELLIDVADYKHVANGPGVMLIAHEANYAADSVDGRLGLLYGRKRFTEGSFAERLRDAFRRVIAFGRALENEPALAPLGLATDRWALRLNDRLLAPNTEETFAAVEPELRELLTDLFPEAELTLTRETDPWAAFGVRIRASVKPNLAVLARRLESAERRELPVSIAA